MSYETQIVRNRAELDLVLPEWREFLSDNALNHSLFSNPDVVAFDVGDDEIVPYIVFVRFAGKLKCIAPFRVQLSRFRMQLSVFELASVRVRLMTLFGNDFVYSHDADVRQCFSRVFESFEGTAFDVSILRAIDANSLLWRYCAAENGKPPGLRFARASRVKDQTFQLTLTQSFDAYLATLGSNTRSSLKRRTKKLLADHSAALVKITAADQARSFLDSADSVFSDSWQAMTYGPVRKNSQREVARMEYVANQGWLRCYLLTSDVGPLAFQFGYQYGDTYYACDFAFAQKWSHLGPGAVLMYLMLQNLHQECQPRVVDLGPGDSPQKRTFRASHHNVGDYYVVPRNRLRFLVSAQRCLSEVEAGVRAVLVRAGVDNAVRRFLKHKLGTRRLAPSLNHNAPTPGI